MNFDYCPNCTQLPQPLTREGFEALISQPWLEKLAAQIAQGDLSLKRNLPAACWQASYGGEKRSNQNARPSGLFALDVDHVEDPEALYHSFQERIQELGIYIVHKTPSTHGLRIVAACRPEYTTIGDNQQWLASEIGVEHDAVTRDLARLSFLVPRSYFYHYDPSVFTDDRCRVENVECRESQWPTANSQSLLDPTTLSLSDSKLSTLNPTPYTQKVPNPYILHQGNPTPNYRGIPYSEIVSELVERTGGHPYEGERNNRLYLICRLLANITDRQVDRLMQVCPRFGLSEPEVRACCESACKSARTEKLPYLLYKVLREKGIDINHTGQSYPGTPSDDLESAYRLPPLPEHLPPLIREFVDTAPDDFKAATALSCLPVCGFLGSKLRAPYIDGELQAPSFIVNIIAPAASGKGSLLRVPDICLERIRQMDDLGREAEAEYQRQSRLKKNDKKQLPEPQPIVRDIPAKVSVAQLLKRMVQAQGLHLISVSPEADTLTNSNKSGAWAQKSDIYRIAMDNDGGRYGQDYKSDISFSATCKMRYNLLTLGTPGAFARAYPDTEDGLITRCIMVELPSQFGKPMPVRQPLTARQLQTIRHKVDALMSICQDPEGNVLPDHHLSLPWLAEGMQEWITTQRLQAIRDDDHARDQLMRRAGQYGFRAGMVASYLHGRLTPERKRHTIAFAHWVADCMLTGLLVRYRDKMNEDASRYDSPRTARFPSVWDVMPDIFNQQTLQRVLVAQGIKTPPKGIIYRWTQNGLIEKQGENYIKIVEANKRINETT